MWPAGVPLTHRRMEEDVMEQPRPGRTHAGIWIAYLLSRVARRGNAAAAARAPDPGRGEAR
jgi:hypothetical protein